MPINVAPEPAPMLASVTLIEQRTNPPGNTVYPTVQRAYVDGAGTVVKTEADAPQVQLDLSEWPDLAAAHYAYLSLLEQAAAFRLGYIVSPGQTYNPPTVGDSPTE